VELFKTEGLSMFTFLKTYHYQKTTKIFQDIHFYFSWFIQIAKVVYISLLCLIFFFVVRDLGEVGVKMRGSCTAFSSFILHLIYHGWYLSSCTAQWS